jgi:hypothetical protein
MNPITNSTMTSANTPRIRRPARVLKRALWVAWAIVPVGLVALHYGPGKSLYAQDIAHDYAAQAQAFEDAGNFKEAAIAWAAARDNLPLDRRDDAKRFSLRQAKARMFADELIEGTAQMQDLLANELASENPDAEFADTLRGEIATAAYYTAWQMRLEGAAPDEWLQETDTARQLLRYLAESARDAGDTLNEGDYTQNLEAVVRLEQMGDEELRAMALPKNCPECKNVSQKKRDQRASKGKGKGKGSEDAREKIQSDGASDAINRGKGH